MTGKCMVKITLVGHCVVLYCLVLSVHYVVIAVFIVGIQVVILVMFK